METLLSPTSTYNSLKITAGMILEAHRDFELDNLYQTKY
jgi:hypothetical protein